MFVMPARVCCCAGHLQGICNENNIKCSTSSQEIKLKIMI